MKNFLKHKQILLGVTGGISAYKSADLVRRLREHGALVRVVMTEHAKEFITPLTMQALSGYPVHDDLFDLAAEAAMGHIELSRWADAIIIAPATADFMARLVKGEAQDLLSTICLAARAPILLAPAMNQAMWKNTLTQNNLQVLQKNGISVLGPAEGNQACGDVGPGRMVEPNEIVDSVAQLFARGSLAGQSVLITAGPTHEAIDPIRYITNKSSGKMGYALAEAALAEGANVTLISGPVHLACPEHVKKIDVVSAEDMLTAVMAEIKNCDIFFGVAAVCDYRCATISPQKIKKSRVPLELKLEPTVDIISEVAKVTPRPKIIGFAAESENLVQNAQKKLREKNLDMIIANSIVDGVGGDDNVVTVLWKDKEKHFEKMTKRKLAREIIKLISE